MENKAIEFATKKHSGQFRSDKVTPYVEHPKAVAQKCTFLYLFLTGSSFIYLLFFVK